MEELEQFRKEGGMPRLLMALSPTPYTTKVSLVFMLALGIRPSNFVLSGMLLAPQESGLTLNTTLMVSVTIDHSTLAASALSLSHAA